MKKILSVILCCITFFGTSVTAFAGNKNDYSNIETNNYVDILVDNGYDIDTAKALPEEDQKEIVFALKDDPNRVNISSVILETDNLSEIEALFAYSEDELVSMGAQRDLVEKTKTELLNYAAMENEKLAEVLDVPVVEAKLIKMAIKEGNTNKNHNKNGKQNDVMASGSISTTKLAYTQSVTDYNYETPYYRVKLSYTWKKVFALSCFQDAIAVAWGGGLNSKKIYGVAKYSKYKIINGDFGESYANRDMEYTDYIQQGIKFTFPQSIYSSTVNIAPKTQSGYANLTLYQTKRQGFDTKVISRYCHRILTTDGGITITASGSSLSPSIIIKSGYDTSVQRSAIISY